MRAERSDQPPQHRRPRRRPRSLAERGVLGLELNDPPALAGDRCLEHGDPLREHRGISGRLQSSPRRGRRALPLRRNHAAGSRSRGGRVAADRLRLMDGPAATAAAAGFFEAGAWGAAAALYPGGEHAAGPARDRDLVALVAMSVVPRGWRSSVWCVRLAYS